MSALGIRHAAHQKCIKMRFSVDQLGIAQRVSRVARMPVNECKIPTLMDSRCAGWVTPSFPATGTTSGVPEDDPPPVKCPIGQDNAKATTTAPAATVALCFIGRSFGLDG